MILKEKIELEFKNNLKSLSDKLIGLAVSGGGDSIALLTLASKWALNNDVSIKVITVNHNLRKESKDEAIFTSNYTKKLGHEHNILEWKKTSKKGNLQSEASLARKQLISNWAKKNHINTVLFAHTLDDQVETILMRFARGSGVDGLTGMQKSKNIYGINWVRPLLGIQRSELRTYLQDDKITWVEDRTNQDKRFLRVQVRDVITELKQIGINTNLLINTSSRMINAKKVLNDVAKEASKKCIILKKYGDIVVNKDILFSYREDTFLRILAGIIRGISGNLYRPRYKELLNFVDALGQKKFKAITLSGVLARAITEKKIAFRREPSYPNFINELYAKKVIWDGRWLINISKRLKVHEKIGPLGNEGYQQIKNDIVRFNSVESLLCTPTLFSKDIVISNPILNYGKGLSCKLNYNKKQFINSFIIH